MKAKTTKDLIDSHGDPVPAGTEIELDRMPRGDEEVIAARRPGTSHYVAVDEYSCEPLRSFRRSER